MGLGKSIIAETVAFIIARVRRGQCLQHLNVPKEGPYGPHIFICQPELLDQFAKDAQLPFAKLRRVYIICSMRMAPPCPGVTVIHTRKDFLKLQFELYNLRDDPSVC